MSGGGDVRIVGGNKRVRDGVADVINNALCVHVVGSISVDLDHGALTGLLDDDHPQYRDGSIAFTGDLDMGSNEIGNISKLAVGLATPSVGATAEILSTTGGLTIPRMTTVQRNAFAPPNGSVLYDTDLSAGGRFLGRQNSVYVQFAMVGGDANPPLIIGDVGVQTEQGLLTILANSAGTTRGNDPTVNMCSIVLEQQGAGDCGIFWLLPAVSEWQAFIDNSDGDKWKLRNVLTGADILQIDPNTATDLIELSTNVVTFNSVQLSIISSTTSTLTLQTAGVGSNSQVQLDTANLFFQIVAHEGDAELKIQDLEALTTPVRLEKSAPDNTLYLDSTGRVGIGTNAPLKELHVDNATGAVGILVKTGNATPADLFLQNSVNSWSMGVASTGDYAFNDITGALIPFVIERVSPSFSLVVKGTTGNVGMQTFTPGAQLHVIQFRATGAQPVVTLDQRDIDVEFVEYTGTSAADGSRSLSSNTGAAAGVAGKIRITVNGATVWLRTYDGHT